MERVLKGRAWKFGHDLVGDQHIFQNKYVVEQMSGVPIDKLAHHVLEVVNPEFGTKVKKGDFVVAGRNFGFGKGHRQGAECLKRLGVAAIIADSVGPRFFRYSVYFALPILIGEGLSEKIKQDDELEVNVATGEIKNLSTGEVLKASPVVPEGHPLFPIIEAGGQVAYIKGKVAALKEAAKS